MSIQYRDRVRALCGQFTESAAAICKVLDDAVAAENEACAHLAFCRSTGEDGDALAREIRARHHPPGPVWCEHYRLNRLDDMVEFEHDGKRWRFYPSKIPLFSPCCGKPRPEGP